MKPTIPPPGKELVGVRAEEGSACTSASLPRFGALDGNGCSLDEEEHGELQEQGKGVVEHFGGCWEGCSGLSVGVEEE